MISHLIVGQYQHLPADVNSGVEPVPIVVVLGRTGLDRATFFPSESRTERFSTYSCHDLRKTHVWSGDSHGDKRLTIYAQKMPRLDFFFLKKLDLVMERGITKHYSGFYASQMSAGVKPHTSRTMFFVPRGGQSLPCFRHLQSREARAQLKHPANQSSIAQHVIAIETPILIIRTTRPTVSKCLSPPATGVSPPSVDCVAPPAASFPAHEHVQIQTHRKCHKDKSNLRLHEEQQYSHLRALEFEAPGFVELGIASSARHSHVTSACATYDRSHSPVIRSARCRGLMNLSISAPI